MCALSNSAKFWREGTVGTELAQPSSFLRVKWPHLQHIFYLPSSLPLTDVYWALTMWQVLFRCWRQNCVQTEKLPALGEVTFPWGWWTDKYVISGRDKCPGKKSSGRRGGSVRGIILDRVSGKASLRRCQEQRPKRKDWVSHLNIWRLCRGKSSAEPLEDGERGVSLWLRFRRPPLAAGRRADRGMRGKRD